jgi:hypothetical protein
MELTKDIKAELYKRARSQGDRKELFEAAWRKILWFNRNSEIDDLFGLYDQIVSEFVNNPKSRFYIYG